MLKQHLSGFSELRHLTESYLLDDPLLIFSSGYNQATVS